MKAIGLKGSAFVTVRPLRREDMLASTRIAAQAFMFPFNEKEQAEKLANAQAPEKGYIGYFTKEDVLTSSLVVQEYQVNYHGRVLPMGGIGNVATLPEFRQGGAVRELFRHALHDMKARGIALSALYPFSHPYYRKFGYELCNMAVEYTVPIDSLRGFRHKGFAKLMMPGDDTAPLAALYEGFTKGFNLSIVRDEERWRQRFKDDPTQSNVYCYLLGDGDKAQAFIRYKLERDKGTVAVADDVVFSGPEGLWAILGFMARFSGQYKNLRFRLPPSAPLGALLEECYDLSVAYNASPMARVVDVERVLGVHGAFIENACTLEIEDDFFPENSGTYRFGSGVVERENERPDAHMDIQTFSQLAIGYLSLDQAGYKPQCHIWGNEEALGRAFPKRDVMITEYF